ncbi:phosphotransferase enzyme family protein [Candidatus Lokiarchaeum ossiferum]|uniref:phosphotransferase enzyme family protein n=1 Tax=Candidatus Lokiarchaeum ossiferum TaxID=2951803 RepID=UPI00352DCE97
MKVGIEKYLTVEVLRKIAQEYSIPFEKITEMETTENFIYEAERDQNSFILRISHSSYRSKEEITAEINWINFLQTQNIPTCVPVTANNGDFIVKYQLSNSAFYAVLFEKLEGCIIGDCPELLTDEVKYLWGKTLARMHLATKQYPMQPPEVRRQTWDQEHVLRNIREILKDHPIILTNAIQLMEEIRSFPQNEDTFGLVHFDLHDANLFINGGNLTVIDFDDCQYDWFISDMAIVLFHVAWRFSTAEKSRNQVIQEFYPAFIKGYLEVNPTADVWLERISKFVQLRHISLFCTLVYELSIEEDDWSQQAVAAWKPMIEKNLPWIDYKFSIE